MQNNFFIKFLRKCNFFAFLAAYQLRGAFIFLLKNIPFGAFQSWLYLRIYSNFGPFRAFSLATNWGDKYFLRILALLGRFRCLLLGGYFEFFQRNLYFLHPRRLPIEGMFSFDTHLLTWFSYKAYGRRSLKSSFS